MAVYKPMRKTENGLKEVKLPYSVLADAPIIKANISTLTNPVADTCYLHIGGTDKYVNGKIYFYNGTEFSAINKDGAVPHIGENGNWWVGDEDLGVTPSGVTVEYDEDECSLVIK